MGYAWPVRWHRHDRLSATFILLNALSALIWALAWVTLGYLFGQALAPLFERLSGYSHFIWAGIAAALCIGSGRDGFQAETSSALDDAIGDASRKRH